MPHVDTPTKIESYAQGTIRGTSWRGTRFTADLGLLLIRNAWYKGCDFEQEADGFGIGQGTKGDWSGIRDSSPEAICVMLAKAIDHLGLEA